MYLDFKGKFICIWVHLMRVQIEIFNNIDFTWQTWQIGAQFVTYVEISTEFEIFVSI